MNCHAYQQHQRRGRESGQQRRNCGQDGRGHERYPNSVQWAEHVHENTSLWSGCVPQCRLPNGTSRNPPGRIGPLGVCVHDRVDPDHHTAGHNNRANKHNDDLYDIGNNDVDKRGADHDID